MMKQIQKGAIYWTELGEPTTPGIMGKRRPFIVFSNKNARPFFPPVVQVLPLTKTGKKRTTLSLCKSKFRGSSSPAPS